MFVGEEAFSEHCINSTYNAYICKALEAFAENEEVSREEYHCMLTQCKEKAIRDQSTRRIKEEYLGKIPFEDDLRRSFDVFLKIVRDMFGFCPYKIEKWVPVSPIFEAVIEL
jgi:hypothetical protein